MPILLLWFLGTQSGKTLSRGLLKHPLRPITCGKSNEAEYQFALIAHDVNYPCRDRCRWNLSHPQHLRSPHIRTRANWLAIARFGHHDQHDRANALSDRSMVRETLSTPDDYPFPTRYSCSRGNQPTIGYVSGHITTAISLPLGHLLACFSDCFTKQGVQLFYPMPVWAVSVANPRRRLITFKDETLQFSVVRFRKG